MYDLFFSAMYLNTKKLEDVIADEARAIILNLTQVLIAART